MRQAPTVPDRPDGRPPAIAGLWCATFAAACALYLATCQRGISWQDSGMFQWRVLRGDYRGDLGLALAHPLYIAAGRAIVCAAPGQVGFLLNAFSGVGMAVALANLAAAATLLTHKRLIGAAAAAMLAVAHTAWWLATVAEVYTWSLAGLTAELWLLIALIHRPRRLKLAALAFVNGLGLCVHNFALLPLPVYLILAVVLVANKRLPAWSIAAAAGAYLAGAGLYVGMTIELAARTGDPLGAIGSALFGSRYAPDVLNVVPGGSHWRANLALAAMNFLSFLSPLAVIGWVRFRRRLGGAVAAALGAITLIEAGFVIRYPVPDQFTFLLPTLAMVALAAAVGLDAAVRASRAWRAAAVAAQCAAVACPLLSCALPSRYRASAAIPSGATSSSGVFASSNSVRKD